MPIKSISQKEFYKRNVQKLEGASMFGDEVEWFEEEENNLLGLIINDKIDKDWVYIILAEEENGEFRAVEVEASIESKVAAESELFLKLNELVERGEFREVLYSDEETPEEKSTIIITDIDEEVKKYFKRFPEKLYDLSPRKFEELVASLLEDLGLEVTLTKATRDGGSDIIARLRSSVATFLMLVECKKYAADNKVTVGVIREVAGVHSLKEPSKSLIITTSTFTKDAIKEAELHKGKIELKNYDNLKEWLSVY